MDMEIWIWDLGRRGIKKKFAERLYRILMSDDDVYPSTTPPRTVN